MQTSKPFASLGQDPSHARPLYSAAAHSSGRRAAKRRATEHSATPLAVKQGQASNLLSLPNELLGPITQLCTPAEIFSLRETSRRLRDVCDAYGFMQPRAEAVAQYLLYSDSTRFAGMSQEQTAAALKPLESLVLGHGRPISDARLAFVLAGCPHLRSLDIATASFSVAIIEALPWEAIPKLQHLRVSIFGPAKPAEDKKAFAAMLTRLSTLRLDYLDGEDDISVLLNRWPFRQMDQLCALTIAGNIDWDIESIQALQLAALSSLTSLSLSDQVDAFYNVNAVEYLMAHMPQHLQSIALLHLPLTSEALARFCEKSRHALRSLVIKYALVDDDAGTIVSMLEAPHLHTLHLERVDSYERDQDPSTCPFAGLALSRWPLLEKLVLNGNRLNQDGASSIGQLHLPYLKTLELRQTGLDAQGVDALCLQHFVNLRSLHLDLNDLSALRKPLWRAAPQLTDLSLVGCLLRGSDLRHIPWAHMPKLERLDLSHNQLAKQGLARLLQNPMPALTELTLRTCFMNSESSSQGRRRATSHISWRQSPKLRVLDLSSSHLTDADLVSFALPKIANLETLYLHFNNLSRSPLHTLDGQTLQKLRFVDLRGALKTTQGDLTQSRSARVAMPALRTLVFTPYMSPYDASFGVAVPVRLFQISENNNRVRGLGIGVGRTTFGFCDKLHTLALPLIANANLSSARLALMHAKALRYLSFAEEQQITAKQAIDMQLDALNLRRVDGLTQPTVRALQHRWPELQLGVAQYELRRQSPDA